MTADPVSLRLRWLSRRSVVTCLVALAVGIGIGVLVDVVSPNPTYGLQIEAGGLAILIAAVVAVIPMTRRLLPAGLGLAIGVIAGVAIGPGVTAQPSLVGAIEVQLGQPEIITGSASETCFVVDGALASLSPAKEGAMRLSDGRSFDVSIGPGEQEPVALDRRLDIVVTIHSTLPDGSPTETRMTSDASSTVSISNAGATGSMAFSGLVLHDHSELRKPIDVAGTVTWRCPAS